MVLWPCLAPIAHEDHALRACYAALAMQTAMQPYTEETRRTRGLELRMRVGLNSGEVVVRAIGNDLHMDYSAVGETTVLAARMEQTATPGTIRCPPPPCSWSKGWCTSPPWDHAGEGAVGRWSWGRPGRALVRRRLGRGSPRA